MNIQNRQPTPYSFTARCSQIRDAQWVCHAVNSTFPHISTTKFKPLFIKQMFHAFPDLQYKPEDIKTLGFLYKILDSLDLSSKLIRLKTLDIFELKNAEKSKEHSYQILLTIKDYIEKLGFARVGKDKITGSGIVKNLKLLEHFKMGNCLEDAAAAELVFKMNGVEACSARFVDKKTKKPIDHVVCLVSRNGALLNSKNIKDVIIVDPWFGKADFAKDMLCHYKNTMTQYFDINPNGRYSLNLFNLVDADDNEIQMLRQKYPQLIFNSKDHNFMQ